MIRCLAILLLLNAASAFADVYRCERNGRLEFSDRACEAGQAAIEIAEPNSMQTAAGDAALAARYDRETSARRARIRAEVAALEKTAQQRRQHEDRIRDATMHGIVAVGMTQAQVTAILGEPVSTSSHESESGRSETWTFRDGNIAHTVQFKDGKVTSVSRHNGRTAKRRR
jgi:hypothetical protein